MTRPGKTDLDFLAPQRRFTRISGPGRDCDCHQQLRGSMLPPGVALDRSNLCVIESQVQPAHQFPNGTRTMVVVDQILNIDGTQQDLPTINGNQSRSWRRGRICHTCSVRTFVDFAIVLWSPSLDFFTASCPQFPPSLVWNRGEKQLLIRGQPHSISQT